MATDIKSKKQHIEGILGEKIADEALALIQWWEDVAISTATPSRTTQRHTLIPRPNRCFESRVVDVSGFATTGNNGQSVLQLSQFLCPADERFDLPINVVATPISAKPFFVTVTHKLLNNGADVEITVSRGMPMEHRRRALCLTGAVELSILT